MEQFTINTKIIDASKQAIYEAFTQPDALAAWLAPNDMKGEVHNMDLREGGGYTMSLYYPDGEHADRGKSGGNEDRFTARFTQLNPPDKMVQAIRFDTEDERMQGEMTMEVELSETAVGTAVTITFRNIPQGISPADNEKGTESSLQKLDAYLTSA